MDGLWPVQADVTTIIEIAFAANLLIPWLVGIYTWFDQRQRKRSDQMDLIKVRFKDKRTPGAVAKLQDSIKKTSFWTKVFLYIGVGAGLAISASIYVAMLFKGSDWLIHLIAPGWFRVLVLASPLCMILAVTIGFFGGQNIDEKLRDTMELLGESEGEFTTLLESLLKAWSNDRH